MMEELRGFDGAVIDISQIPQQYKAAGIKEFPITPDMSTEAQRDSGAKAIEHAYKLWQQSKTAEKDTNDGKSAAKSKKRQTKKEKPVTESKKKPFTANIIGGADVMQETEQPILSPPSCPVLLEFENCPVQYQAWYHRVILAGEWLVLLYDTRIVGYPKFKFPASDSQDPTRLCIMLEESKMIFEVEVTNVNFDIDYYELTVLKIVRTVPNDN